ncbi:MAG: TolB family protein, partial [Pirellulaceae bacterium]
TGDWDIYAMNADGTHQRRLAGNPGLDRAPAWSPDGKRLAWESHVSEMPNIWIVDADGGGSRPLILPAGLKIAKGIMGSNNVFNFAEVEWPFADNTFYLMDPVWSPDGTRIAAVLVGGYGANTVVVVEADGSQMFQVNQNISTAGDLAWSPDGTRIAGTLRCFPQESEHAGLFVVNADGTDKQFLVDVTPVGPRLGGAKRHGLMSWYSHGSAQPRRVVKTFCSLAWSPDG